MITVFPESIAAPPVPLSPGVVAGGTLYVSGQVASDAEGAVYRGDFDREVTMTLDNVERVLVGGGASWSDVVKVGAWLGDISLFARFNELYAARLGDHRPARTTVVVEFGHPDVRVEVDAIAHLSTVHTESEGSRS